MTCNVDCSCGDCGPGDLPVNLYEALRVSYGMLLGADDFRAMIGNPRGKQMLHSAWLHGSGVVWGFDVCLKRSPCASPPGWRSTGWDANWRARPRSALTCASG